MPDKMSPRERVRAALQRSEPDRVPYCEIGVDRALAQQLMGWGAPLSQAADLEANPYALEEVKALAAHLNLDDIWYVLRAPVYAHKHAGKDGRLFYGEGTIHTLADLERVQLPDPTQDSLYAEAERFARNKGDFSAWFVTRVGIFSTILSMGIEAMSLALYEDRPLVEALLDRYCDWTCAVAERVCQLGFDAYVSTDDMAFKTAPYFSPAVFREVLLPRFQRVAKKVTLPWIIHSDGNILPYVPDLLDLGIAGLHPNEKGAIDIVAMKRDYGKRVCLLGNVDLNLLGMATPQEVDAEVRQLIHDVAPGGGYILTSGNSLAGYLLPDNVHALSQAVLRYGKYPIAV
ncbi:MAG: uroporphyrinogen decarboxylase family protein [Anaerolineae bacterium]